MSERSTLLNAAIGAAVSVVLTFLPFSPVLGGGVAGYLQRGDYYDGAKVGAISGLIATLPMAVFVTLLASVFAIVPAVGGRPGIGLFFGVVFVMIVAIVLLYTVALSALGGVLAVVLREEFGDGSRDEEPVYDEPPVQSIEEELQDEY